MVVGGGRDADGSAGGGGVVLAVDVAPAEPRVDRRSSSHARRQARARPLRSRARQDDTAPHPAQPPARGRPLPARSDGRTATALRRAREGRCRPCRGRRPRGRRSPCTDDVTRSPHDRGSPGEAAGLVHASRDGCLPTPPSPASEAPVDRLRCGCKLLGRGRAAEGSPRPCCPGYGRCGSAQARPPPSSSVRREREHVGVPGQHPRRRGHPR
jgi:hypothetical protein